MFGPFTSAILDLLTAGYPLTYYVEFSLLGTYCWEKRLLCNIHRYLEVLLLKSKGAGHTAAAGGNLSRVASGYGA